MQSTSTKSHQPDTAIEPAQPSHTGANKFNSSSILKAYFDFIGFSSANSTNPDVATLKTIVSLHILTFPYQNTAAFIAAKQEPTPENRIAPPIELDQVAKQMLEEKIPGYCYQNSTLLYEALMANGYTVKRLGASVLNCDPETAKQKAVRSRPIVHVVIKASIGEETFIIDSAFAHKSPLYPIPLKFDVAQQIGEPGAEDTYRLVQDQEYWRLDMLMEGKWMCCYLIDQTERDMDFIRTMNSKLFQNPGFIPIRDQVVKLGRVEKHGRKSLIYYDDKCSARFTFFQSGKKKEDKTIQGEKEFFDIAKREIGIDLDQKLIPLLKFT